MALHSTAGDPPLIWKIMYVSGDLRSEKADSGCSRCRGGAAG